MMFSRASEINAESEGVRVRWVGVLLCFLRISRIRCVVMLSASAYASS